MPTWNASLPEGLPQSYVIGALVFEVGASPILIGDVDKAYLDGVNQSFTMVMVSSSSSLPSKIYPPSTKSGESNEHPVIVDFPAVARDAFSRMRISEPTSIFDSKMVRGRLESLFWQDTLTAGGTVSASKQRASVSLTVTNIGDKVVRRTRRRMVYQPGRSMLHLMSGVIKAQDENVNCKLGYFDLNDGIMLSRTGGDVSWIIRSGVSGAPVEDEVIQSGWNVDKMDGSGPSGLTLDISASFLLWIDLQWLSVGTVRVGFDINGVFCEAHRFNHVNITDSAYMSNPNLPLCYEVEAVGQPSAPFSLEAICTSCTSEGGDDQVGISTTVSSHRDFKNVDDSHHEIMAVRVKSSDADRVVIDIAKIVLMCSSSANIHWALVLNPVGFGVGAWVDASGESSLEVNYTRGTGWSGGAGDEDHILDEGYFSKSSNVGGGIKLSRVRAGVKADGSSDIISLVAVNASASSTEKVFGMMIVDEFF